MRNSLKRVVKKADDLRTGKQHIVFYDTPAKRDRLVEECGNHFVIHSKMTVEGWQEMIADFNAGQITTLIADKSRMGNWSVDKSIDEVDVVFTFEANQHLQVRGYRHLQHFRLSDIRL
jgi:hypothetical protein